MPRRRAAGVRPWVETLEHRLAPALTVADLTSELAAPDLVAELLGDGVAVSNVTFTGHNRSAGIFQGDAGIIGFERGIVLSSGWVSDIVGPNTVGNISRANGAAGDQDLNGLVNSTLDAAVLEFDFVADYDAIAFQYVFASEEYTEWVDFEFNDVFGFFVNGQNVALIPGTEIKVAINSVNHLRNSEYFIDNTAAVLDTQMDGLTVVLSAVARVTPNEVNHIKLAVADVGDRSFDSNVFIKASSFIAATAPALSSPDDQQAAEGTETTLELGSFVDPDGGPWTVIVNWGDESSSQFIVTEPGALQAAHTYAEPGDQEVTVTVTDQSNLPATATFLVDVADPPPIVTGDFAFDAIEGSEAEEQVVAAFTDPGGALDIESYSAMIDWGDGETSVGLISGPTIEGVFTVTGSHHYANSGIYTIQTSIGVIETEIAVTAESLANVANVAPLVDPIAITGDSVRFADSRNVSIAQNARIAGSTSFTDPGTESWTITVNFGDGSAPVNVSPGADKTITIPEHVYTATGNFVVTLTVADDEDSAAVAFVVNVLKPKEFLNLGNSAVSDLSAGGPDTLSSEAGGHKVAAKVKIPFGSFGEGVTVSLANFSQNPTRDGSESNEVGFSGHALIGVNDAGAKGAAAPVAFFDVRTTKLANIVDAELVVTFSYSISETETDNVVLYFWDGSEWQQVLDGVDRDGDGKGDEPVKVTLVNPDGSVFHNPDGAIVRTITVTYNEKLSSPLLSQLRGTVFAVAAPIPSASSTTVATISSPFSVVSSSGQSSFITDAAPGRTVTFINNSTTTLTLRVSHQIQTSVSRGSVDAPEPEERQGVDRDAREFVRSGNVVRWLMSALQRLWPWRVAVELTTPDEGRAPPANPAEGEGVRGESAPEDCTPEEVLFDLPAEPDMDVSRTSLLAAAGLITACYREIPRKRRYGSVSKSVRKE